MKAVYLLPCPCGNKVPVDGGQAGAKISCTCGKQLTVPTFRALKELEMEAQAVASAAVAREAPAWSTGRGMLFSFGLLVSVIATLLICYNGYLCWVTWDGGEPLRQSHLEEMRHSVEHLTAVEAVLEFQKMAKAGLSVDGVPPWSDISEIRDISFRWLIGALVALAVGLVSTFGSLLGPAGRPRPQ